MDRERESILVELAVRRPDIPAWMREDRTIGPALKKRPVIGKYLVYVYELNADLRGNQYEILVRDKADKLTGGKKYGNKKWDLSVYVSDAEHYNRAAKSLVCSEAYLRKLNALLVSEGIFQQIGDKPSKGRPTPVIADGYFVKTRFPDPGGRPVDKLKKVPFWTEEKRQALRRVCESFRGSRPS